MMLTKKDKDELERILNALLDRVEEIEFETPKKKLLINHRTIRRIKGAISVLLETLAGKMEWR